MAAESRGRLGYLDALRGLAALWVLVEHTALIPYPTLQLPSWLSLFVISGSMGVELFFVVSAFSLCYAMPRHEQDSRPLLGFAIRRFFRIAPLFYAILIVTLIWNPWHEQFGWKHILANVLFLFNFPEGRVQWSIVPAGWTIGVEMPFYLLFPLVYRYTKGLAPAALAFLLAVCVAEVTRMTANEWAANGPEYMRFSLLGKLPIFAAGIVTFYLLPKLEGLAYAERLGWVCLGSVPFLFFAISLGQTAMMDAYHWRGIMFSLLVIGLALAPLRAVVNTTTQFLGKISYSIYLLHIPIILMLQPVYRVLEGSGIPTSGSFITSAVLTIGVTVAVATAVNRLFESKLDDFGKALAARFAGHERSASAVVPMKL